MDQLKIKKRSFPEWSALLLVFLPFIYSFLVEFLKLPSFIRFVSDFLLIALVIVVFAQAFLQHRLWILQSSTPLCFVIVIFLVYVVIGYVFNYQSIFYLIWGIRNNFRFYFAVLIFLNFLNTESASQCLKFMDFLFWLNFALTILQFIDGYEQDFLGGLFGTQKGCNGYTVVFLCIVVSKSLLSCMNGDVRIRHCFITCAASFLVAVLAELKVFFIFFILIYIIAAVLTRYSTKKIFLILLSSFLFGFFYAVFIVLFEHFQGFLSLENLFDELLRENYASGEDLGRFTSIPMICELFLTNFQSRFIGMGIGNCDTSTISIFNTLFYDQYVDLHYSIVSVSFLFLETGIIGLALFISFFVICLTYSIRKFKRRKGVLLFNQMGIIMSLLCLILMFYNSSLRTEAGYIVYFILALPFIGVRNDVYARHGG